MDELERHVLAMLLAGDHLFLAALREQFALAEVVSREFSGVGFFTTLRVPPSAPRVEDRSRLVIGDVYAEVSGLEHAAGFLLYVSDGALDMLECFIVDDQWPTPSPTLVRAYYVRALESGEVIETSRRDLQSAFK